MHGWEPLTTQRGYGRDGNQVPLSEAWEIVTETEPEWSDDDRIRLLALAQYESGVHECGFHWSLLEDKSNVFMPEHKVCPVCRGATRYARIQNKADEGARKQNENNPHAPDPADGRSLYMRQLSPHEAAELREGR